jgi:hypothetical protein
MNLSLGATAGRTADGRFRGANERTHEFAGDRRSNRIDIDALLVRHRCTPADSRHLTG